MNLPFAVRGVSIHHIIHCLSRLEYVLLYVSIRCTERTERILPIFSINYEYALSTLLIWNVLILCQLVSTLHKMGTLGTLSTLGTLNLLSLIRTLSTCVVYF